jgi:hypothetical protein
MAASRIFIQISPFPNFFQFIKILWPTFQPISCLTRMGPFAIFSIRRVTNNLFRSNLDVVWFYHWRNSTCRRAECGGKIPPCPRLRRARHGVPSLIEPNKQLNRAVVQGSIDITDEFKTIGHKKLYTLRVLNSDDLVPFFSYARGSAVSGSSIWYDFCRNVLRGSKTWPPQCVWFFGRGLSFWIHLSP